MESEDYRDIGQVHDVQRGLNVEVPVDYNMEHLTLSKTMQGFLNESKTTRILKPLFDQIVATNYLDKVGTVRTKFKNDIVLLKQRVWTFEDFQPDQNRLNVAQSYMHQLIDSTEKGYRGRLATEIRRVYRAEQQPTSKKRWGIF